MHSVPVPSVSFVPSALTARVAAAAQSLRKAAAPWHRVRPLAQHWPCRDAPELDAVERKVVGVVRAALAIGAPGVEVSIGDLVELTGKHRATVCRALERLDECRRRCVGPCSRPGVDRAGKPRCRGCSKPCAAGCQAHRALIRRVHQFTPVRWGRGAGECQSRNRGPDHGARWKNRQGASVIVLGAVGRERFRATPKQESNTLPVRPDRNSNTLWGRKRPACGQLGRERVGVGWRRPSIEPARTADIRAPEAPDELSGGVATAGGETRLEAIQAMQDELARFLAGWRPGGPGEGGGGDPC